MKGIILIAFICLSAVYATTRDHELTLTPFGYMPKGCVHPVYDNEIVHFKDGILKIETTEIVDGKEKSHFRLERHHDCEFGRIHKIHEHTASRMPNGWAAYAKWLTTQNFNYFGGYWTVPDEPTDEKTQTLFLFTGFQNAYFLATDGSQQAVTSIIQPVLQWGSSEAGDMRNWAIASWFVAGEQAVYSELKGPLGVNDTIFGTMDLVSGTKWSIGTADTTQGINSTITVDTSVSEIDAFVTLEVYTINSCNEYPNGVDTFYNLYLEVGGSAVTPTWSPDTEIGCEEAITIVSPTEVTVKF